MSIFAWHFAKLANARNEASAHGSRMSDIRARVRSMLNHKVNRQPHDGVMGMLMQNGDYGNDAYVASVRKYMVGACAVLDFIDDGSEFTWRDVADFLMMRMRHEPHEVGSFLIALMLCLEADILDEVIEDMSRMWVMLTCYEMERTGSSTSLELWKRLSIIIQDHPSVVWVQQGKLTLRDVLMRFDEALTGGKVHYSMAMVELLHRMTKVGVGRDERAKYVETLSGCVHDQAAALCIRNLLMTYDFTTIWDAVFRFRDEVSGEDHNMDAVGAASEEDASVSPVDAVHKELARVGDELVGYLTEYGVPLTTARTVLTQWLSGHSLAVQSSISDFDAVYKGWLVTKSSYEESASAVDVVPASTGVDSNTDAQLSKSMVSFSLDEPTYQADSSSTSSKMVKQIASQSTPLSISMFNTSADGRYIPPTFTGDVIFDDGDDEYD